MTTPVQLPGAHKDVTFRNYSATAAQAYASARGSYPADLYSFILSRHDATGGRRGLLLDVGCGPGIATRDLSPAFDHAVGADPGVEMIAAATSLGGRAKRGDVVWKLAGAEEIADEEKTGLAEGSVDLLTAATAAHWFEMPAFWKQAAKLVKPGGSVAIFTKSSYSCHPGTPNIDEVQRIFDEFERAELAPYELPGNRITREFYDGLGRPWDGETGDQSAFPQDKFERHVWNRDGSLDGPDGKDFFGGTLTLTFPQMEKMIETASPVTRWREAHPNAKGTEADIIKSVLERVQQAAGTSELGMATGFALLFFKRS